MNVIDIIFFIKDNAVALGQIATSLIGIASIVVKLTPTLKDDTFMKEVIKFVGKFIALNHTIDPAKQKLVNKK